MIYGTTGSERGLHGRQADWLAAFIAERISPEDELIDGDCIGVDDQVNRAFRMAGCLTRGYPGMNRAKRAFGDHEIWHEPRNNIARDEDIAWDAGFMLCFPWGLEELLRDGTWTTIRRARHYGTAGLIIYWTGLTEPLGSWQPRKWR